MGSPGLCVFRVYEILITHTWLILSYEAYRKYKEKMLEVVKIRKFLSHPTIFSQKYFEVHLVDCTGNPLSR